MKVKKLLIVAIVVVMLGQLFANFAVAIDTKDNNVFYEDFNDKLDGNKWLVACKAWGGGNNGVVPKNVKVDNGILRLEGHGNNYQGDVEGINSKDGKRCGAAIATKEYFGSGSYEIKAKLPQTLGACSAMWTFEYEEYYPGDEKYKGSGEYYAVNHEIDIEFPGRYKNDFSTISYEYALCNNFIGEKKGEYVSNHTKLDKAQNDGQYHTYRFDWHTGSETEQKRVDFYVDGKKVATNTEYVPTNKGRFWIGIWFPNGWAGEADFDVAEFDIDYVKITPFNEPGDVTSTETYANGGWGNIEEVQYITNSDENKNEDNKSEDQKNETNTGETPELKNVNPDFGITMDKAIGANSTIDDTKNGSDLDSALGVIREYHNLHWNLDSDYGKYKYYFWNGYWDFDDYYRRISERGDIIAPCIQGTCKVMSGNWGDSRRACMQNASPILAESYKLHGEYMFQYAARYGKTKVDNSRLQVADGQEKKSGLGYVTYYENNNEPDKTWEGPDSNYTPAALAAMCSADYDGDEGRFGENVGIKNADQNSKLVMGGLAGGGSAVQYLNGMKDWFYNNRTDKKIAFDVINFHSYCGTKCPEADGYKERLQKVTEWRNTYARDKEVWITEFGWDSASGSTIAAPNNETARDWLIRSYLLGASAGVDRQTMYMLLSASSETDNVHYMSSGLATKDGTKKPAWYSVYALKNILTNYKFDSVVKETNDIYIYKFVNSDNDKEIYAMWCPTSENKTINDYEFEIDKNSSANLIKIENEKTEGVVEKLDVNNNKAKLAISELPVFVEVSKDNEQANNEPKQDENKEENKNENNEDNSNDNKAEENSEKNEQNKEEKQEPNREDNSNRNVPGKVEVPDNKEEQNKEDENKKNNVDLPSTENNEEEKSDNKEAPSKNQKDNNKQEETVENNKEEEKITPIIDLNDIIEQNENEQNNANTNESNMDKNNNVNNSKEEKKENENSVKQEDTNIRKLTTTANNLLPKTSSSTAESVCIVLIIILLVIGVWLLIIRSKIN